MDPREEELLTHVAAGTDPLTAWAALPDDDDPPPRNPKPGCVAVLAVVLLGALLSTLWH